MHYKYHVPKDNLCNAVAALNLCKAVKHFSFLRVEEENVILEV